MVRGSPATIHFKCITELKNVNAVYLDHIEHNTVNVEGISQRVYPTYNIGDTSPSLRVDACGHSSVFHPELYSVFAFSHLCDKITANWF